MTFVLKTPIRETNSLAKDISDPDRRLIAEIHEHLSKHGDAVKDIAFEVDDARAVYQRAVAKGALSIQEPATRHEEKLGEVTTAVIRTYGDTTHTLVEKSKYKGVFLPGYRTVGPEDPIEKYLPRISLDAIDHCVGNQDWDEMENACD